MVYTGKEEEPGPHVPLTHPKSQVPLSPSETRKGGVWMVIIYVGRRKWDTLAGASEIPPFKSNISFAPGSFEIFKKTDFDSSRRWKWWFWSSHTQKDINVSAAKK